MRCDPCSAIRGHPSQFRLCVNNQGGTDLATTLFHDLGEGLVDSLARDGSGRLALGRADSLETSIIVSIGIDSSSLLRGLRGRGRRGGSLGSFFETFGILRTGAQTNLGQ